MNNNMSSVLEETLLLDHCVAVCIFCIKYFCKNDLDSNPDDQIHIDESIREEIKSWSDTFNELEKAAQYLVGLSSHYAMSSIGKVTNSVKLIWHGELSEENFKAAADSLFKTETVTDWDDVGLLVYFMYRTVKVRESSELMAVVNLTANYLADHAKEFLTAQNEWPSSTEEPKAVQDESNLEQDVQSSMVIVQQSPAHEPVSTSDSTPFSMLVPPIEEDEKDSLNSATPPEIIDRPPMTESLMQIMQAGGIGSSNGNTGASSDSTDFEMVASAYNSTSISCPSSPKNVTDEALSESGTETAINKQMLASQLQSIAKSNPDNSDTIDISESKDKPSEGASVSDYLPQISLGVAAACIGFFVLKKATS